MEKIILVLIWSSQATIRIFLHCIWKFSVGEGTFYSTVESCFTPNDPVGDLIALLFRDLLPHPSSRLAQDPLEEMCWIDYCNQHPLAYETAFPLAFPCIDDNPPCSGHPCYPWELRNYHYSDMLHNQCSFAISENKLPTQHSLVDLHISILEDIEEEIIF